MDLSRDEFRRLQDAARAEPATRRLGSGERAHGISETTRDEVRHLYEAAGARMDARRKVLDSFPAFVQMQKKTLLLLVALVFVTGGISGYAVKEAPQRRIDPAQSTLVMIDLRSGRTFQSTVAEAQSLERDADARVAKAMWCPACRKWHPLPPPETYENNRWQRPTCKVHSSTPLQATP
jgi:hypothetical protein